VGAAVVACGDAAPVLEPAEHALDAVALLVDVGVVGDRRLSVRPARDAGRDLEIDQGLAEPVTGVAFVGDQDLGVRERRQDGGGAAIVESGFGLFRSCPAAVK
jgi:hypothetical protein